MAWREEWVKGKKPNFHNSLNDIITATMKPILNKYSKIEADMILNWGKIFDSGLASKASFKKIVFTDRKNNKFVLHVNVKNADMLEVSYASEIMKEQLAIFLGFQGCEKIVISKLAS